MLSFDRMLIANSRAYFGSHGELTMAMFSFSGKTVNLPAVQLSAKEKTQDETAWRSRQYISVRLVSSMSALRVHTNNRSFPGREASAEAGTWLLIGDVIQAAPAIASSRSLPAQNPASMAAFTHTSDAKLAANTVLNVGVASAKFGGRGGNLQAEYVSGPRILFTPLEGKHWHGRAGHA
jgi:hypothetical protein